MAISGRRNRWYLRPTPNAPKKNMSACWKIDRLVLWAVFYADA
jgi:hypothetical protein